MKATFCKKKSTDMKLLEILFWYGLTLSVYLSGYITMRRGLKQKYIKPSYSPPGWFIAFMWFVLYMLQATAAWMLMRHMGEWHYVLTMYCVFLGLSFFYGPAFSLRKLRFLFMYTLLLLVYASVLVGFFFNKYAWSGWIFLPTVIWLAFATWLSFSVCKNNQYPLSSSIKRRNTSPRPTPEPVPTNNFMSFSPMQQFDAYSDMPFSV